MKLHISKRRIKDEGEPRWGIRHARIGCVIRRKNGEISSFIRSGLAIYTNGKRTLVWIE